MAFSPYYDNGVVHIHNPNRREMEYVCGRGHVTIVDEEYSCHCGWNTGPDKEVS